ncbi:MAG: hypothetical protein DRR16_06330 [Candidatus Parabeggiatoa sp. nov. 3]|nr:MAG: hypothetical protein DRR16_06330 [Gammaproteobacteria bacterium]HEW97329.1 VWA domain-containing protein [Beggiatoa sp.]
MSRHIKKCTPIKRQASLGPPQTRWRNSLTPFFMVGLIAIFSMGSVVSADGVNVYDDCKAISIADVQTFLNGFKGDLKKTTLKDEGFDLDANNYNPTSSPLVTPELQDGKAGNLSPAKLIYYSAKENDLNPVLLMAKIQQEQNLIGRTFSSPEEFQHKLNRATGYGISNSNPSGDPAYSGFFAQLVGMTYQFDLHRDNGLTLREAYDKYTYDPKGQDQSFQSFLSIYNLYADLVNQKHPDSCVLVATAKSSSSQDSVAIDAALLVSENYPDGSVVVGGTSISKQWILRNKGNSEWDSNYKLVRVDGTQLNTGANDVSVSGTVAVGGTYTFTVPMKAPNTQGSTQLYRENWKLVNPSGTTITIGGSATMWAEIKVPRAGGTITQQSSNVPVNLGINSYKRPFNPFDQWETDWYECTRYAFGRAHEKTGQVLTFSQNYGRHGGKWYDLVNDLPRGSEPRSNSLVMWSKPPHGHVAFVEKVDGENITITEANWSPAGKVNEPRTFTNETIQNRDGYSLVGYIYLATPTKTMLDYQADSIIRADIGPYYIEKRSTFIAILVRALEKRAGKTLSPVANSHFSDVSDSSVKEEILKAEALGIIDTSNSTFRPTDPISRIEALTFMVRTYEKLTGHEISPQATQAFVDVSDSGDASWMYSFAQKGFTASLTSGYPTDGQRYFKPTKQTPRMEGVAFVEKLIRRLYDAPNGGDGNGDGIPDHLQPNVMTTLSAKGEPVTVSAIKSGNVRQGVRSPNGACIIENIRMGSELELGQEDEKYGFIHGLLEFNISNCQTAQIIAYYHGLEKFSQGVEYRQFGPTTPGDETVIEWYTLPNVKYDNAVIGTKTVATTTFTLSDGVVGDDTTADGMLIGIGGVGTADVTDNGDDDVEEKGEDADGDGVASRCSEDGGSLDIVYVLDVSGSMRASFGGQSRISAARQALLNLNVSIAQQGDNNGRVGLVTFNSSGRMLSELTSDIDRISSIVSGTKAGGGTALHKGVDVATNMLSSRQNSENLPLLVLFSDGGTSVSHARTSIDKLHRIIPDAVIYSVGVGPSAATSVLQYAVDVTDGKLYSANDAVELTEALEEIFKEAGCSFVCTAHGKILDDFGNPIPNVTVQVDDITTVTNETGFWEISGLPEKDNMFTASKDGYTFTSKDAFVGRQACMVDVKLKGTPLLTVNVVKEPHGAIKQGENVIYTATITNKGSETATDVVFTDALPENTSVVSIYALEGGDCDVDTVSCALPDLAPNASATIRLVVSNTQTNTLVNIASVTANEYPADAKTTWTEVKPYLSVSISDEPDPVMPGSMLFYTLDVELNQYASRPATDIILNSYLPDGVELKSVNTEYGNCDTHNFPMISCEITDLDVNSPNSISHVTVDIRVVLEDPGLLLLTHEARVSANEYPLHKIRERTEVDIGDSIVDMVFIVDDSGSMQAEINGVKKALIEFINAIDSSKSPLIALITFKDDVKVRAFTRNLEVLLTAINALKASGGGTCEEASVEAINIGISHTKEGGFILFVTDASPYEDADVEGTIERLRSKGLVFNPMITGDCSQEDSWN